MTPDHKGRGIAGRSTLAETRMPPFVGVGKRTLTEEGVYDDGPRTANAAATAAPADASARSAELNTPASAELPAFNSLPPRAVSRDAAHPIHGAAMSGASAGEAAPVQRSASGLPCLQLKGIAGVPASSESIHAAAERGTATPATTLPYADQIQRAFGRHDISGVKAHTGSEASAAAGEMGASAYATGVHVVLDEHANLHTAAHEAAHVVQQRGGVQLKGGVGEAGDAYERHADRVADAVVQGKSAEHVLDQYAPGGGGQAASGATAQSAPSAPGGAIQLLALVKDKGTGKLRRVKAREKGEIDTMTLSLEALNPVLASLDEALAAEIRRERAKQGSPSALNDIAEVFTIATELEALEAAREQHKPLDKAAIATIVAKLSAAHVLLQSVELPDKATLYRDTIAAYTRRLHVLDSNAKLSYKDGDDGLALGVQINAQNRADYRADVARDGVWGGLAEAEVAALHIGHQLTIFRIDAENRYRRVTRVGAGAAAGHNLLHLGNHYVAIPAAIVDGAPVTAGDGRIETTPDGNCMYEAIQICQLGVAPTAPHRAQFIAAVRAHVAAHLSVDAVDTSVIAILAQGERAGLGPKMAELVKGRRDDARVKQLDEVELGKLTARFVELPAATRSNYAANSETYLTARKADPKSKATADALAALEDALARAQMALAARDHKVDPTQLELPLEWWSTVKAAVGDKALTTQDNPFSPLVAQVVEFNRKAKGVESTIPQRLAALAEIEDAFKNLEAPTGPLDKKDSAHEQARIAVYGFQTVELRKVRANLVGLFQLTEGSPYRTGQPGNRPDLHYDFHRDGEKAGVGQHTTPDLAGLTLKEQPLVGGTVLKEKQEGLSAVALQRAYPNLFSEISKAPRYKALRQNVEYYDNNGCPWDQVSGHSFTKGGDNVGAAIAASVRDHLDNKNYPRKGTKDDDNASKHLLLCGVVLDCTYLDHNDYVRMWTEMLQRMTAAELRERVVEINVPFGADAHKDDRSKPSRAERSNTVLLDKCRTHNTGEPDQANQIYNVSTTTLAALCIGSIKADEKSIIERTFDRGNVVYRNHGGHLPNNGSYFLEFYPTESVMPTGAEVRIVFDQPNEIFYVTGTHYRPFVSPHSAVIRNPFYRIVT